MALTSSFPLREAAPSLIPPSAKSASHPSQPSSLTPSPTSSLPQRERKKDPTLARFGGSSPGTSLNSSLIGLFTYVITLLPTGIAIISPHVDPPRPYPPADYAMLLIDSFMLILVGWIVGFLMEWPWLWLSRAQAAHNACLAHSHAWAESMRLLSQVPALIVNPFHTPLTHLRVLKAVAFLLCIGGPFIGAILMVRSRTHFETECRRAGEPSVVFNDFNVGLFLTWAAVRFLRQVTRTVEETTITADLGAAPLHGPYDTELKRLRSASRTFLSEERTSQSVTLLNLDRSTLGPMPWKATPWVVEPSCAETRRQIPLSNSAHRWRPHAVEAKRTSRRKLVCLPKEKENQRPREVKPRDHRRSILFVSKDTASDTYNIVARDLKSPSVSPELTSPSDELGMMPPETTSSMGTMPMDLFGRSAQRSHVLPQELYCVVKPKETKPQLQTVRPLRASTKLLESVRVMSPIIELGGYGVPFTPASSLHGIPSLSSLSHLYFNANEDDLLKEVHHLYRTPAQTPPSEPLPEPRYAEAPETNRFLTELAEVRQRVPTMAEIAAMNYHEAALRAMVLIFEASGLFRAVPVREVIGFFLILVPVRGARLLWALMVFVPRMLNRYVVQRLFKLVSGPKELVFSKAHRHGLRDTRLSTSSPRHQTRPAQGFSEPHPRTPRSSTSGALSTIANKQRPKKFRPLYKRYVYGSSASKDYSSDEEAVVVSPLERNVPLVRSIYVLTEVMMTGRVWPKSKFEKVDVLRCAVLGRNPDYEVVEVVEEPTETDDSHLLKLPMEIIGWIFQILALTKLSPRVLRLNKAFYNLCLPMIYERPNLASPNFSLFVEAISGNKKLGAHVRVLDMCQIQQSSKNSFVSRLLRRCSVGLHSFTAPQTSFGYAPLVSLRHCHDLRVLDLRLVSETVDLKELFDAIKSARNLTHLSFPRSSVQCTDYENLWPPNLWYLRLSGGISDDFLFHSEFPSTLRKLEFSHCPYVTKEGIYHLLFRLGKQLTSLVIQYPMPGLGGLDMDMILKYCPNLLSVEITVDYVTKDLFDEFCLPQLRYPRPLRSLLLESSGMIGQGDKLHPDDVTIALAELRLPCLKNVRINVKLGWNPESEDMEDLVAELEDRGGGVYMTW